MTTPAPSPTSTRYWDRHAARYDRSLGPLGRPIAPMLARVARAVDPHDDVLEVAAGTGLVTPTLARAARSVRATDPSAAMLEQLRRRVAHLPTVACEAADIYALPYPDARFDAVVASNVLHLLPDLPGALRALTRVLRPGGRLIAPTFLHAETWRARAVSWLLRRTGLPLVHRFTLATLRAALEDAGLTLEAAEVLPGALPLGWIVARRAAA